MRESVKLLRVRDDQKVDAEMVPLSPRHLSDFETLWRNRLQLTDEQDRHWDWLKKYALTSSSPSYESYALECECITQGLMLLEIDCHYSRLKPGKNLIYLDYLATAPWNRRSIENLPLYKGVGFALFCFAVERSMRFEYKGRVGLHSLPRAESFYIKLNMVDFGQDASKQNLKYFELSEEVAKEINS